LASEARGRGKTELEKKPRDTGCFALPAQKRAVSEEEEFNAMDLGMSDRTEKDLEHQDRAHISLLQNPEDQKELLAFMLLSRARP
jgi:hypothetical protein